MKSVALGENDPPVTEEVQVPCVVPPLMVPDKAISSLTQLTPGPETVKITAGYISIQPDNTLSPHSLLKVRV